MNFKKILLLFPIIVLFGVFHFSQSASAADYTVCENVCTHTTITDALLVTNDSDTITVDGDSGGGNAYIPGNETFNLDINDDITLSCINSATIGTAGSLQDINIYDTDVTIQNCNFDRIQINSNQTGSLITGNTFETTSASEIDLWSGSDNATVSSNTGLNGILVEQDHTGVTVTGNTVNVNHDSGNQGIQNRAGDHSNYTISNNTVINSTSARTPNPALIFMDGDGAYTTGVVIQDNILSYPVTPSGGYTALQTNGGNGLIISGNYITTHTSGTGTGGGAISLWSDADSPIVNAVIQNNTIKLGSDTNGEDGISIRDDEDFTSVSATVSYNLIYSEDESNSHQGLSIDKNYDNSTTSVTEDYNGFFNINYNVSTGGSYSSEITFTEYGGTTFSGDDTAESTKHRLTGNPGMMTEDAGSANDMYPFPGSCYLDVNGGNDIGAYSAAKRAAVGGKYIINVDDNGTIDYSSVDFTSIKDGGRAACYNDYEVNIAAGTYSENVWIANKGDLVLEGAGSGTTTIDSSSNGNTDPTLLFNAVKSATVSGFTLTSDATDLASLMVYNGSDDGVFSDLILSGITPAQESFVSTYHPYSFTPDRDSTNHEYTADSTPYFVYNNSGNPSNDLYGIDANDKDITSIIDTNSPETWHLMLTYGAGVPGYYTFYFDDALFPDSTTAKSYLDSLGAGSWDIDCWSENAFVYSGGGYSYTAPTVGSGECLGTDFAVMNSSPYQTSPTTPGISVFTNGSLYINSSDGNSFSNMTIGTSTSDNGVAFVGTSASNTLGTNITYSNNTIDIITAASSDNTVTTADYCATLNYTVASTGKLLGCNTAPTATSLTATQAADTSNSVDIEVTIDDYDNDDVTLQVQYGLYNGSDCATTSEWTYATLTSVLSTVDTTGGASAESFAWNANSDVGSSDGEYCVRVTATDDDNFTSTASEQITYTYQAPAASSEGGGSPISTFLSGVVSSPPSDTPDEPVDEPADEEPVEEEVEEPVEIVEEPVEEATEELPNDSVVEFFSDLVTDEPTPPTPPAPPAPVVEEPVEEEVEEPTEEAISESTEEAIENYEPSPQEQPPVIDVISAGATPIVREEIGSSAFGDSDTATVYIDGETLKLTEEEFENLEIDLTGDLDGDGNADAFQLAYGESLFNEESNINYNVFCGLDLLDDSEVESLSASNLELMTTGNQPAFRICSNISGKAEISYVNVEDEVETYLGSTELDEDNKTIFVPEPLPEGEHYLVVKMGNETEVSQFTVDSEVVPATPEIVMEDSEELGPITDMTLDLTEKAEPEFDKPKYIASFRTFKIKGVTDPNMTVYIAYKSRVLSSVALSDANGEFVINSNKTLAALEPGEHEILVYAQDGENSLVSNVSMLLFNR